MGCDKRELRDRVLPFQFCFNRFLDVYVNDRVTQMVGLTKEQILGKTIWGLFPEVVGSVFERQIRQAAAEFTPVHFEYCHPPWQRWFECMSIHPRTG